MKTENNRILVGGVIIAIVLSIISLVHSGNREIFVTASLDEGHKNSITVTGKAERMVKPDTASVSFTMTKKSKTLSIATNSVNERIAKLLEDLSNQGVEKKDIKTTNYNVRPEYNWHNKQRKFDGYRVTQSIQIKIRDLEKVESVLSEISKLEVDNVSQLNFFVDDDEKIKEELRSEAIKKAKKKAQKLAQELGISLETIIAFNEGGNRHHHFQQRSSAFSMEALDEESMQASIPVGENKMRSTVSITYRIK